MRSSGGVQTEATQPLSVYGPEATHAVATWWNESQSEIPWNQVVVDFNC